MIKLKYFLESDYYLCRYMYVINLLKEVNENICPIEFIRGREVYFSIYRKPQKFAAKGLLTPKEVFRTVRNFYLDDSLFLYVDDTVEYYWHRDIEKALEEILKGGIGSLSKLATK